MGLNGLREKVKVSPMDDEPLFLLTIAALSPTERVASVPSSAANGPERSEGAQGKLREPGEGLIIHHSAFIE
jgi:hypothetical protein